MVELTISELIDKLIIADMKVWHYLEKEDAESFKKMKIADKDRHVYLEEIDKRLGEKKAHKDYKTY